MRPDYWPCHYYQAPSECGRVAVEVSSRSARYLCMQSVCKSTYMQGTCCAQREALLHSVEEESLQHHGQHRCRRQQVHQLPASNNVGHILYLKSLGGHFYIRTGRWQAGSVTAEATPWASHHDVRDEFLASPVIDCQLKNPCFVAWTTGFLVTASFLINLSLCKGGRSVGWAEVGLETARGVDRLQILPCVWSFSVPPLVQTVYCEDNHQ